MIVGIISAQRRPTRSDTRAPEAAREEREDVAPEHRNRHLGRGPAQFLRQIGSEHGPDRVVGAEVRGHPHDTGEGVVQILALEDGEQRQGDLPLRRVLDLLVFRPNLGLFHVHADPDAGQGRQHAQDQHPAPPVAFMPRFQRCVQEAVGQAGQCEAQSPGPLQDAGHQPARSHRPGFHRQRRAGRPFRPHADAQQRPDHEQEGKAGREAREEIADGIPKNGDHQRRPAPQPIGQPAGRRRSTQAHDQRDREDRGHVDQRNPELLRDRRHDQKEDCEVEGVERPTHPGGAIGVPLVLCGFFPPRNICRVSGVSRHRFELPARGLPVWVGLRCLLRAQPISGFKPDATSPGARPRF